MGSLLQNSTARDTSEERWPIWLEALTVLVLLAMAAFFRLYRLDSLPPGLYQDEAVNGINGLNILDGRLDIYFGEREPLYMYLVAGLFAILDPSPLALRLTSALVGMATVALAYFTFREMYGRRAAILAAAGLSLSLWHIFLSRVSFRAITLPLLELGTIYFLWHALRKGGYRWWAASGVLTGLSIYTYIASRLFPVLIAIFLAIVLLTHRRTFRSYWRGLAVYIATSIAAATPLLAYFITNPVALFGRAEQVAIEGQGAWSIVTANALKTLGMFGVAGDANWRHNLSGEPVFPPPLFLLFLWGYILALQRWRQPGYLLAALWLPLMVVPTILSVDSPHYLRTIGALPAAYAALGIGMAHLIEVLAPALERVKAYRPPATVLVVLAVFLVLGGWGTYHSYFQVWAGRPEVYAAFNGPLAEAGRAIASSKAWQQAVRQGEERVFVTSSFYDDRASIAFFLWPRLPKDQKDSLATASLGIKWFDDQRSLVFPTVDQGKVLFVFQRSPERSTVMINEEDASQLRPPKPGHPLETIYGDLLKLEGYDLDDEVAAGQPAKLALYWTILGTPDKIGGTNKAELTAFVHLLDSDGQLLAAGDSFGYPVSQWQKGDRVVTYHKLEVPVGTPPGKYPIRVGVYSPVSGQRLSLKGNGEGQAASLAELKVRKGSAELSAPPVKYQIGATTAVGLTLVGYNLDTDTVEQGQGFALEMLWRAEEDIESDYNMALKVVDRDGKAWSETPGSPAYGTYPTHFWEKGELVRDRRRLALPAITPPGNYSLRLILLSGQGEVATINLGPIAVREIVRIFQLPQPLYPALVGFGDQIELLGYDLEAVPLSPGTSLKLTLYWRAKGEMKQSYKVFVHMLDENGKIISQVDTIPAGGARPTTSLAPGEVLADRYEVPVPANTKTGRYNLVVGLYEPSSGQRLALVSPAAGDTSYSLPTAVTVTAPQ